MATSSLEKITTTGTLTSWENLPDHKLWMTQIHQDGNKPEDWLQFLELVEENCSTSNQESLLYLDQAYRKARESIPIENKQANAALATIFINSADIKQKLKADGKARYLLRYARANFRTHSMVHLAAAQFELDQGDKAKCIAILEKACMLCPTEANLQVAIKRVSVGHSSLQENLQDKDVDRLPAMEKVTATAVTTVTARTRRVPQRVIRQMPAVKNTDDDDDDDEEDEDDGRNVRNAVGPSRVSLPVILQPSAVTEDSGITVETPPTDNLRESSTTGPKFPFCGKNTESSLQTQVKLPVHSIDTVLASDQQMSPVPDERKKQIYVKGVKYSIIKVVGKGGSSKVYQVLHEDSKKIFAVKYVDLECADDLTIESYRNEITVLQRLQSKKPIIKLYDYEIGQSHIYLVMECGSIDLASFLRRKEVQREDISFYWRQMLMAVQCIHDEGIIHRDLKPANFLFVEGSLKLIDFGIANSIQNDMTSVTRESQVGTLNYMSPETIQSSRDCHGETSMRINRKSDVWSLGCILYYITYGNTPFQSIRNTMVKLQAICNPDYQIEFPDIDDSNLKDVVKRCLVRDVKQRPSIKELLDHPYVASKTVCKDSMTTPALDVVETLMSKLTTTSCTSPRSVELAMALQKYLGSHHKPAQDKEKRRPLQDVNSISQTNKENNPLSSFFPNH